MNKKHYENIVIINANLDDSLTEETVAKVQESIKTNGGEISDTENWGRKRLAYAINNSKTGYYLITRFSAPPEAIKKIERALRLDENIIRYMTIALDKKALEHLEKIKSAKQQNEQEIVKESTTNDD